MALRVAIIGAGPAGLVACKTFLKAADSQYPFDPIVFEGEDDIGGTFRYRGYDGATLVSSKQLTSFSDFRLPFEHADHLSLEVRTAARYDCFDTNALRTTARTFARTFRTTTSGTGSSSTTKSSKFRVMRKAAMSLNT